MLTLFLEFGARTRPQDLWQLLISAAVLKFLFARKSILLAMKMILITKLKVK